MVYQEWKQFEGKKVVATSQFSGKIFDFLPNTGKVLDLGCGNGRLSKQIKDKGYEVWGIDVNKDAINVAKNDSDLFGIIFSVQDATKMEYEDNFFDGVIEQAVLACMDKSDRQLVLREIYRIIKKGGILSIGEFGMKPNREEKYKADALIAGEYGTMIIRKEDGTEWFRSHNFTQEELEELIKEAGFEIIDYMNPVFKTFHGNPQPGHQYLAKKK